MQIDVPDEIYEEFCTLLDAGVQFLTGMAESTKSETGRDVEAEYTDAEKRAIKFVENREWKRNPNED